MSLGRPQSHQIFFRNFTCQQNASPRLRSARFILEEFDLDSCNSGEGLVSASSGVMALSGTERSDLALDSFSKGQRMEASVLSSLIRRELIYSAGTTEIMECGHVKDGSISVALKRSKKESMTPRGMTLANNELVIAQSLIDNSVPELVKIYGAFEAEDAFYQVMERCQMNLYTVLHQEAGFHFTEEEVCNDVLHPLLKALAFLHSRRIVHRDVKLENLLLSDSGIKLADFGLSIDLTRNLPTTRVGTIDYNAPEMFDSSLDEAEFSQCLNKEQAYDEKVDIWALGVVAYELLFGQPPFFHEEESETEQMILQGTVPGFFGFVSPECQDFLQLALRKKAEERPSAESLLDHPWLRHHAISQKKSETTQGLESQLKKPISDTRIHSLISPMQSLSPRMGSWKITCHRPEIFELPGSSSPGSDASGMTMSQLELSPSSDSLDYHGADDILPRSPLRRQGSRSSRASSEILSYVEAAPQLEDLREEAAESSLHPVLSPDLVHLESLGSTEANSVPNLLPSIKHVRRQGSLGKSRFA